MSEVQNSIDTEQYKRYEFTPRSYAGALETYLQGWRHDGSRKPFGRVNTWGAPGVGKTEMMEQLAKKWKRRLVTLHLSQKNPHDLQGIPLVLNDGNIQWMVSSYFPQQEVFKNQYIDKEISVSFSFKYAKHIIVRIVDESTDKEVGVFNDGQRYSLGFEDLNEHKFDVEISNSCVVIKPTKSHDTKYSIYIEDACIMFLDDLSAANKSVLKAALQLINDYRVGEYDIPVSCPLASASNHEGHSSYIEPMSAAVANRLLHIHLVPSIEDSIEHWIKSGVDQRLIAYFSYQSQMANGIKYLYHFDKGSMKEGRLGFRSPRSWIRMAEQLEECMLYDSELENSLSYIPGRDKKITEAMIVGFVGQEAANNFISYLTLFSKLPNAEDILTGKIVKIDPSLKNDVGYQHGIATTLSGTLKRYYELYYDPNIKDLQDQNPKWKNAVTNFCSFTQDNLKKELNMMVAHLITNAYKLPLKSFWSHSYPPAVSNWIDYLLPLTRRVTINSNNR